MGDESIHSWVDAQVQTIVSALGKENREPSGGATFQLVPDWGSVAERERAFALVADRLRTRGRIVSQNGPSLFVIKG